MPGIANWTDNVTIDHITNIVSNITEPVDVLVNINQLIYDGWLFFVLLLTLWVVMMMVAWQSDSERKSFSDLYVYMMYSGAIVTILAFFFRIICFNNYCLLNDFQFWIFPIITILIAATAWATREG